MKKLTIMKTKSMFVIYVACFSMLPVSALANAQAVLAGISLLADVKELTSGLTLNQTAADSFAQVTVLGIPVSDGPHPSTGIFSSSSQSSVTVGGASANANAVATVGNWEPFSSSGTVLTVSPTTAKAAMVNGNPASALATATAAINGHVTSTKVIAPPPTVALDASQTVPVLFAVNFQDVQASANETVNFTFGVTFAVDSVQENIIFATGQIGGSGNSISLPFLEAANPSLASQVANQFLTEFAPNASGVIDVGNYMLGEGILPSESGGASGFVFDTTLDEEYIVNGTMVDTAVDAVPEPETCALVFTGLGLLGVAKHRRHKATS